MKYKPYNKQALIAVMQRQKMLGDDFNVTTTPPAPASGIDWSSVITSTPTSEVAAPAASAPSFWDVSKWPSMWESGAQELEKTAPGRLITAPIRLPEAVLTATSKTVQEVPNVVKTVERTLPIIAIAAVVIVGGIAYYKFSKGKKGAASTI
jgi:hypothetical protein